MLATVNGVVILKKIDTPPQGSNKKIRFQIALNQGRLENDTINVTPETYEMYEQGDKLELKVDISAWSMNGKTGLSIREAML